MTEDLIAVMAGKAVETMVKVVTETVAGGALKSVRDFVKARLTKPAAAGAVADLETAPRDADAQAQLRLQLKKALAEDPKFRDELGKLLEEAAPQLAQGVSQSVSALQAGGAITVTQIAGSRNRI